MRLFISFLLRLRKLVNARTVFTHELITYQRSNEWHFLYKSNQLVNTVKSVLYLVLCLLRATRRSPNPNFQVVITHALHLYSQHSFGLPLRLNGMHRTQFDHARLDFLSLVIWSRVLCHVKLPQSSGAKPFSPLIVVLERWFCYMQALHCVTRYLTAVLAHPTAQVPRSGGESPAGISPRKGKSRGGTLAWNIYEIFQGATQQK